MKKIRVGVLGAYRGTSMINYCKIADNAEVVAICDKWKEGLERQKSACEGYDITFYDKEFGSEITLHEVDSEIVSSNAIKKAMYIFDKQKEFY